jgi:hypothetical protein
MSRTDEAQKFKTAYTKGDTRINISKAAAKISVLSGMVRDMRAQFFSNWNGESGDKEKTIARNGFESIRHEMEKSDFYANLGKRVITDMTV